MKSNHFLCATIAAFWLFLFCNGCGEDHKAQPIVEKPVELTLEQKDSISKEEIKRCDTFPKINYKRIFLKDNKTFRQIFKSDSKDSGLKEYRKVLFTLNRKEFKFFRVGDSVIVPDIFSKDVRIYSCFPQCYPGAKDIKKIIMVSNKLQCYACYEYGKLVRFAAANTGKEKTPTYPGRYGLSWKERMRHSSIDSSWIMPFDWNFHKYAGNGMHQFEMPGRPVSHSCIRQLMDDAEWMFKWGEGEKKDSTGKPKYLTGTPLIIIDIFNFSRKHYGPWADLTNNKDSILKLPLEPMKVEEALIPWCQIPDDSKGAIPNRKRYIHAEDTLRAKGIIRQGVELIETVNYNKVKRQKAAVAYKKKMKELKEQQELQPSEFHNDNSEQKKENIDSKKINIQSKKYIQKPKKRTTKLKKIKRK